MGRTKEKRRRRRRWRRMMIGSITEMQWERNLMQVREQFYFRMKPDIQFYLPVTNYGILSL